MISIEKQKVIAAELISTETNCGMSFLPSFYEDSVKDQQPHQAP